MTTVIANNPLGLTGCAGGIEDIQRIGRCDGHALMGLRLGHNSGPIDVPPLNQRSSLLRPLQDNTTIGPMRGQLNRLIQQGFVGNHTVRLDAAGCRHNYFRLRIINSDGKLI